MENIVFGQSLMGFNRVQVLQYIDTLVKQLKDQELEYTEKQQRLQQEVDSLAVKCDENKGDLTLTVEKIKQLSKEIEYFKNNNFELKEQIDHYRNLILAKDSEIIKLKKDTVNLKNDCERLQTENTHWQAKQNKIAECLVEAELKADEIVQQAHKQAQEVTLEMRQNAGKLTGDVIDLKDEIFKVEKQLESSFKNLQKAMETMDLSAQTIEKQVDDYKNKIDGFNIDNQEILHTEKKTIPQNVAQAKQYVRPVKKSLTDTVLDTISKILEK